MNFFEPGEAVETSIVAITNDYIFLNLNTKSEGVLDRAELADENGNLSVKEGDVVKVFFLGFINGEMRFTTKISGDKADKSMLENAYKNSIPVEGHVEKEIKGGFEVKIGSSRAFCPYSQMGFKQKESADFYVGKALPFIIQEYKENGRNILVSNKMIGANEYQNQLSELSGKIKEGSVVEGEVKALHNYGAFIDIGGFQALLPISEISRTRVEDINSVLTVGQKVTVSVIKADWKNERVSVSLKALQENPWDGIAAKYPVGKKFDGTVSRVVDFGVFVTLENGIDGLVHISELENAERNTNIKKLYKKGDSFSVVVKEINAKQERIALKPASSSEQDETTAKYMKSQDTSDVETYNPFAALLKKK